MYPDCTDSVRKPHVHAAVSVDRKFIHSIVALATPTNARGVSVGSSLASGSTEERDYCGLGYWWNRDEMDVGGRQE